MAQVLEVYIQFSWVAVFKHFTRIFLNSQELIVHYTISGKLLLCYNYSLYIIFTGDANPTKINTLKMMHLENWCHIYTVFIHVQ